MSGSRRASAATSASGSGPAGPLEATAGAAGGNAQRRRRLKIFFGYASGVGRTQAMRQAARALLDSGASVLIVEEARRGSAAVGGADGVRPQAKTTASETGFDLDAALLRKPDLILLPHLERRNRANARHRRRYQDVLELLEAGIDVWSTLEVRHIESLGDLVERLTRSPVQDTVPDAVFEAADEVELIDMAPGELLDRLRRARGPGAPHDPPVAEPVLERTTLVALREIALRYAADRLNRRARTESDPGSTTVSTTMERLLVCVGPSPTSARVIRTASRMARSMHASWIAVHVGRIGEAPQEDGHQVSRHLQLAESLGAHTVILPASDVSSEIVEFARSRHVSKIIIGKTGPSGWRSRIRRSVVDQVIAASGDIDVYVIRGTEESGKRDAARARSPVRLRGYVGAAVALGFATTVAWVFEVLGLTESNQVLVYLLGVTAVAAWFGRGPAAFASVCAVLLFNFFFTIPRYTFAVHDSGYVFTFAVMLVIGLLVSTLTARIREQSLGARQRERRTEQLYRLSQDLSATTGQLQIVSTAQVRLSTLLDGDVSIILPSDRGDLQPTGPGSAWLAGDRELLSVANWVYEHGRIAGTGTETHADASALCLPLKTPEGVLGVLAIRVRDPDLLLLPDRRRMVETFAAQVTLALQRDGLAQQVHRTLAQAENERLRNAVLSCVSHDFRTPLATITGASSSLLDGGQRIDPQARTELLQSIREEADRLARLVDNLLHMTKLESGQLEPVREWNFVEDIVGSSVTRLAPHLGSRELKTAVPAGLPLIRVDGALIELVLINLLDNAIRYSPSGTPIEVGATADDELILLAVADRGPGLTDDERARAFEKFYRGPSRRRDGSRGSGLGLAICAAIAQLHGGRLQVENRQGGGARFVLSLPVEKQPPTIDVNEPGESTEGARSHDW